MPDLMNLNISFRESRENERRVLKNSVRAKRSILRGQSETLFPISLISMKGSKGLLPSFLISRHSRISLIEKLIWRSYMIFRVKKLIKFK